MQAYVGGLFREQGLDVVKEWLNPLFIPRLDGAYQAESREHLVPASAAPAATSSPPPQSAAPSPSPPGGIIETPDRTIHARLRSRTTQNSSGQTPRVASPLQREADRPNSKRKRRGSTLRDGGSRDAGKTIMILAAEHGAKYYGLMSCTITRYFRLSVR